MGCNVEHEPLHLQTASATASAKISRQVTLQYSENTTIITLSLINVSISNAFIVVIQPHQSNSNPEVMKSRDPIKAFIQVVAHIFLNCEFSVFGRIVF